MNTCAPLPIPTNPDVDSVIVAFLGLKRAPKLLASLAAKIPSDVIPMPVDRLSAPSRGGTTEAAPLNGVVVCVSEGTLPDEDRAILRELGSFIPVLRLLEDPREAGRNFFHRCRETHPRIPRRSERLDYRRPVVVARTQCLNGERLVIAENISPGGLFLKDPCQDFAPDEVVKLRFPGLPEVPALLAHVRWVREDGKRSHPPGYGCAFENPADLAVRRLLAAVESLMDPDAEPPLPPQRRTSRTSPGR